MTSCGRCLRERATSTPPAKRAQPTGDAEGERRYDPQKKYAKEGLAHSGQRTDEIDCRGADRGAHDSAHEAAPRWVVVRGPEPAEFDSGPDKPRSQWDRAGAQELPCQQDGRQENDDPNSWSGEYRSCRSRCGRSPAESGVRGLAHKGIRCPKRMRAEIAQKRAAVDGAGRTRAACWAGSPSRHEPGGKLNDLQEPAPHRPREGAAAAGLSCGAASGPHATPLPRATTRGPSSR